MTSKKDYKKFAELVKDMQNAIEMSKKHKLNSNDYVFGYATAVKTMTNEMSDIFASDNPYFDRERFLKACGFSENS